MSPHAYQEHEAIIEIPSGKLLEGKLPNKKMKLIAAWIEIHEEELMANWKLAVEGNQIYQINPLR